jgi:hypothetical protein
MDEDNDGRFPDDSLVEVRYPLTRSEQQGDRSAWPWLPGSILGQCGPDEWHVRVEARELATLGNGSPASAGTLYGGGEQGFLGSILAQVELAVSVPAEQRGEDVRRELAQQVPGCAWAGRRPAGQPPRFSDVRAGGFEDPQAEQPEHGHESEVARIRGLAGCGEKGFELQMSEPEGRRFGGH